MPLAAFLTFPGSNVTGESTDAEFPNSIEVRTFSVGNSRAVTGTYSQPEDEAITELEELQHSQPGLQPIVEKAKKSLQISRKKAVEARKETDDTQKEETQKELTFSIRKSVDYSTAPLFQKLLLSGAGESPKFETALVTLRNGLIMREAPTGGVIKPIKYYIKYEFKGVGIDGYHVESGAEDGVPEEEITFRFEAYVMTFQFEESTPVVAGWNIAANKMA